MSDILIKVGERSNTGYKQFVIDSASDLDNLEKKFGNIALCLENKKYYVCNSSGNYIKMN